MASSPSPSSPSRRTFGFMGRFWKPRAHSASICSERQGSSSTIGSPPFTPDSSISIYTNSQDSDCSTSSNTSNSNRVSPSQRTYGMTKCGSKRSRFPTEDIICSVNYQSDNERYAANMFYDMGDAASFECRVPVTSIDRSSGNGSIPVTPNYENDDRIYSSYYNNQAFTTFPNPRRHSIAYSSYSSSLNSNASSKRCGGEEMIELLPVVKTSPGLDGYLVPISERFPRNSIKRGQGKALYMNDSIEVANEVVRVDVHTSESSDTRLALDTSANSEASDVFTSSGSTLKDSRHAPESSFSTSTAFNSNGIKSSSCSSSISASQIFLTPTDCDPFCSICTAPTRTSDTSWKTKSMDVAIVFFQDCSSSKAVEDRIRTFFDNMMIRDNQKMDVRLKTYDVPELDHRAVMTEVHGAKVQIVIISKHFLERLKNESGRKRMPAVNRVFRSKRVIAILTETTAAQITTGHQDVLARFSEWFSLELGSPTSLDPDFCIKFTDQVLKIYSLEQNQAGNFTVFPMKITKEQPKIHVILKTPVDKDDDVKIEISRGREVSTLEKVSLVNPYTAILRIPEAIFGKRDREFLDIALHVNNQKRGIKRIKYENQARLSETDLIDQMMKAAPNFRKFYDAHAAHKLYQHYNDGTDPLQDPELDLMADVLISKPDEFPTILHFAVRYELALTVWVLLDEGDGYDQSLVQNDFEQTPIDNATGNIAQILRNFTEMNVSLRAVDYAVRILGSDTQDAQEYLSASLENMAEEEKQKVLEYAKNLTEIEASLRSPDSDSSNGDTEAPDLNDDVGNQYENVSIGQENKIQEASTDMTEQVERRGILERKRTIHKPNGFVMDNCTPPNHLYTEARWEGGQQVKSPFLPDYDVPREDAYQIPPPAKPAPTVVRLDTTDSGYIVVTPSPNPPVPAPLKAIESPNLLEARKPSFAIPAGFGFPKASPKPVDENLDLADKLLAEIMNDFKNNIYNIDQIEVLLKIYATRGDVGVICKQRKEQLEQMQKEYRRQQRELRSKKSVKDKVSKFLRLFSRRDDSELNPMGGSQERIDRVGEGVSSGPNVTAPEIQSAPPRYPHIPDSPPEVLRRPKPPKYTNPFDRSLISGSYVIPSPSPSPIPPFSTPSPSEISKDLSFSSSSSSSLTEPPPPLPVKPKKFSREEQAPIIPKKPIPAARETKPKQLPLHTPANGSPPPPPPRTDKLSPRTPFSDDEGQDLSAGSPSSFSSRAYENSEV